jgi:isocitrate/isopropylmalate dehydrogenase
MKIHSIATIPGDGIGKEGGNSNAQFAAHAPRARQPTPLDAMLGVGCDPSSVEGAAKVRVIHGGQARVDAGHQAAWTGPGDSLAQPTLGPGYRAT